MFDKASLLLVVAALLCACAAQPAAQKSPAEAVREAERIFPPWQHGANNDAIKRGLEFTVPQVDVLADFHGDLTDPKLVLYVGGNYFFALAPLVKEFEDEHPEFKGRLYWETIPPGMLVDQIKAGGTITSGNMTWTVKGDAYFAGLNAVKGLIGQGLLDAPAVPYVTNTLAIMVPKGNPRGITSLADLAKPDLRLAMPNPKYEGIARQIRFARKSRRRIAGPQCLRHQGSRRQRRADLHPPSPDPAIPDARRGRCGRDLAIGSDVPGRSGQPDWPRQHPG